MADVRETVILEAKVEGEKDVQNLGKAIKDNQKATEEVNNSTKELSGSLDKMTGGAVSGFTGMLSSVKAVITGFRTMRGAIIATGIGALVVIVGSLIAAFQGSEEGQNKLNKIFAITGAVVGNLVDLFADLGDAIISAVENPSKAWDNFTKFLGRSVDFIKVAFVNPFVASFENLGLKFQQITTKARIAWNEFTGDHEQADLLKTELDEINEKVAENERVIKKGALAIVEAYNDAKNAVKGFIDENIEEGKAAGKVADMRAKADKIERALIVRRAELENKIAQLRLKSRQEEEFSAEERRQALLDAQDLEEELLRKETESLKLRADAQSLENTFARSNKQNLDEEARLKAAVIQQEAKRTNAARSTQRELNRINKEIIRDEQKLIDEQQKNAEELSKFREDLRQKERDRLAESELEKLEIEEERKIAELENLVATETEKQEALLEIQSIFTARREDLQSKARAKEIEEEEKLAEQKRLLAEKEAEAQRNRQQEFEDITAQGLGALAESTGLGKEFAIARTLFDTFQSARAAFSSQLIAGDPTSLPRAIGAAAFSAVSGLADVAAIRAIQVPNVAGGGSAGGGSQPTPPTPPSFNLVGASGTSAITQPLIDNETPPVQAFVVSKNVTTAQQADRNAEVQSTF